MAEIIIETSYYAGTQDHVELPDGIAFADIKDWYVKWHTFHYTTDNQAWHEIPMNCECDIDMKRPANTTIYKPDGEGFNSGEIIAERD